jgi:hemerythrin-like domain-containing protein
VTENSRQADRVIGPFRTSRERLHAGLRSLQTAGGALTAEPKLAFAALDNAVAYLRSEFLPQSQAEEFVLFPAVDGVMGSLGATNVMRAQHAGLAAMASDFERVVAAARRDGNVAAHERYLLPLTHGLYAAIRSHLEAEDGEYLPLLDDHLSESQVDVIVRNMDRVSAARASGN